VPGQLADRGVELVVQDGEALVVAVPGDLLLAAHEAAERGDVRRVGPRRGQPNGGTLERLADELRVRDGRLADPRDERAELGHDLHEALVAQADQRLANGRAADGEPLGELVLREPLSRRQLRGDDRVAQRPVDLAAGGTRGRRPQAVDPHVGHPCILTYQSAPTRSGAALRRPPTQPPGA
jgi:hypothetical protein